MLKIELGSTITNLAEHLTALKLIIADLKTEMRHHVHLNPDELWSSVEEYGSSVDVSP